MTIANLITILRFLLVPAVVYAMLSGRMDWAFAGFLVAGVSDGVDGFVARHFNQRIELGAYLDPMADKLLLVSVFVVLGIMGELPLWLVIVAVSRDALIICAVLLSSVMAQSGRDEAAVGVQGKHRRADRAGRASCSPNWPSASTSACVAAGPHCLSGLLTVASAAAYLVAWLRHMGGYGEGETPDG